MSGSCPRSGRPSSQPLAHNLTAPPAQCPATSVPCKLCAPPPLCPATSVPRQLCAPPALCPATSVPRRLYAPPHLCPAGSPPGLPSLTLPHLSRPDRWTKEAVAHGWRRRRQQRPVAAQDWWQRQRWQGGRRRQRQGQVVGPGPGIEAQRRQGPKVAGSRRVRAGQWVVAVVVAKPKALKPRSGALITGASLVGETRTRRSARPRRAGAREHEHSRTPRGEQQRFNQPFFEFVCMSQGVVI